MGLQARHDGPEVVWLGNQATPPDTQVNNEARLASVLCIHGGKPRGPRVGACALARSAGNKWGGLTVVGQAVSDHWTPTSFMLGSGYRPYTFRRSSSPVIGPRV